MGGRSNRRVPRQARHTVEVGIMAGEMRQAIGLHRGDNQRVAAKQPASLANRCPRFDERRSDRLYLNAKNRDLLHGLAKLAQLFGSRQGVVGGVG